MNGPRHPSIGFFYILSGIKCAATCMKIAHSWAPFHCCSNSHHVINNYYSFVHKPNCHFFLLESNIHKAPPPSPIAPDWHDNEEQGLRHVWLDFFFQQNLVTTSVMSMATINLSKHHHQVCHDKQRAWKGWAVGFMFFLSLFCVCSQLFKHLHYEMDSWSAASLTYQYWETYPHCPSTASKTFQLCVQHIHLVLLQLRAGVLLSLWINSVKSWKYLRS